MRIDLEDLRRHYASLPDGALMALNRAELSDAAKPLYDEEVARRELSSESHAESFDERDEMENVEGESDIEVGPEPDWVEEGACACSFASRNQYSDDATDACAALKAAGIPCHVITEEQAPPKTDTMPLYAIRLMVPVPLALHAASVLERDIFNHEQEAEWRASFEMMSDSELRAVNPEILCAGILDRLARLRRAYEEEMAHRNLPPRR